MSLAPSPSAPAGHSSAIAQRFGALHHQGRCALMPFLMAGDPDLATTADSLLALQENGADLIELGVPYSDPLADGPVIQAAAARALAAHTTPAAVLALLASLRGRLTIPVILFTYSNPLLNRGMEAFCQQAAEAGAAGLVVPDLPLEEAEKLSPIAARHGLDLVLLVAPTTPPERMARIHVEPLVQALKGQGGCPVAVGFGISSPEQARQVRAWGADGAIVGSALVKVMAEAGAAGEDVAAAAGRFCTTLRQGLDQD
jgi:tryptophan synthase alpha chain